MLFDVLPKEKKEDLFNYKKEYNRLVKGIKDKYTPLIVITGLRRTGKTSMMKVVYNEIKTRKVYIDGREIGRTMDEISKNMLAKLSEDDFIAKIIGRISSVQVSHFPVSVKVELAKNEMKLAEVLSKSGKLIIFIDEAQLLKPSRFDRFLAYAYDNLHNVKFVLSGSEIGVLDKFLGRENEEAPLFGRAIDIIHLRPLPAEKSMKFLEKGLIEIGKKVDKKEIDMAVEQLDGIVGWLTMFGWFIYKGDSVESGLKKVLREGAALVKKEFEKFLLNRYQAKKRYTYILKNISREPATWTEIKEYLERKERKNINSKQITKYLENLIDYGFLIKSEGKYHIPDPIIISLFK